MNKNFVYFLVLIACASERTESENKSFVENPLERYFDDSLKPFYHGVASGDPLTNAIIIWTKITPEDSLEMIKGEWKMSSDRNFNEIVNSGNFETTPSRDYTIKVDVNGLEAGTTYYYRFEQGGFFSPIGRTKTASAVADSLKFAIVSCSNYEQGFFNTYARIAERNDLDAVIHLGDYIYEYEIGHYGDSSTGRFHEPPHEIVSIQDYRTRYAQYRLDNDLRAVHQSHPFITIWDDHEIANNTFKTGAQNHQPEEGDFDSRKNAARQAYYEWLPIRESSRLYRSIDYGNLAEIIMLDERIAGRTAPVDSVDHPAISDTTRSMLGSEQLDWFKTRLVSSEAQWKLIGNQVIFSYLNRGYSPVLKLNMDSWDGYPAERLQLINYIKEKDLDNIIFITGDTHSSWAFEVTEDPFDDYQTNGAVAIEFGTASINAANANERQPTDSVKIHEDRIIGEPLNPHLKYANLRDHGYLELSLKTESVTARWIYVDKVNQPSSTSFLANELIVYPNTNLIQKL